MNHCSGCDAGAPMYRFFVESLGGHRRLAAMLCVACQTRIVLAIARGNVDVALIARAATVGTTQALAEITGGSP